MEFYNVGKHCTHKGCNQLDFLPYTCHRCKSIYCQEHWKPDQHSCPHQFDSSFDSQVPVCPICNQPIPTARNTDPNISVNNHIAQNCPKSPTSISKTPVYKNSCSFRSCKSKSMVNITCSQCGKGYCIKHRLEADHKCSGPIGTNGGNRNASPKTGNRNANSRTNERGRNGSAGRGNQNLSEDEQIALALSMSLQEEEQRRRNQGNSKTGCVVA